MGVDKKFDVKRKKHYNPNKDLIFKKNILARIFTITLKQFNKTKKKKTKTY